LTVPADQINYEGDTVTLSVSASDSSSGTVRYSAIGLPVGLSINTGTGAISGTIAVGAAASSPYSVLVTASDGTYSISQTFAWYVLSPISIIDPGEQFFSEGDTVSSQIEVIYSGSGTLTYSAVDDLPDGLWINSATGFISGTISGSTAALGEIFSVIRVTDGTTTAFQTILWNLTGLLVGQAKDLHLDTVVLDSWTEWATGDKITRGNLNSQINNYVTNIRREKSAALAVLKLYVLQKGGDETTVGSYADVFGTVDPKIGLTKKNLEQFATLRGGKGAPALVKRAQALDALFLDYVKYAESLKTPVAATSVKGLVLGSTTTSKDMAESIQQGIIGDCSFLAALINYVRATSPDDVVKRFKLLAPDKNGRQNFQVKLYDERGAEKWIDVQEPTYAERIIYGHGSIDTIWVALFEAAYVKMRLQEDPKFLNNPRLLDGGYLEQPVEADNIKSAISRLTGSRRSDFRAIQGFKDKEWALVLPTTTKPAVVSACTPKTLPREALAEGIVPYHAYAVISYDMDKGIVILRNPHNRPSVKGGAEVRLTLAQFRAWFVTLASDKTLSLGGN